MSSIDHRQTTGLDARFSVRDYDLDATLDSGQAFRWRQENGSWTGVIGSHWVRLRAEGTHLKAETAEPVADWRWLTAYLQLDVDLDTVVATFPKESQMETAVRATRGLRLLRQDPWECLASFILSSTKRIIQIQQIVERLCNCYGEPVTTPPGASARSFPSAARLVGVTEAELRACKMGFRAPYLIGSARKVAGGEIDLLSLGQLPVEAARASLLELPGVGRKIADCVLLFAYGFRNAFPIDVWVMKALRDLYFAGRPAKIDKLRTFSAVHFGPNAGYAQQYLFHYMRKRRRA